MFFLREIPLPLLSLSSPYGRVPKGDGGLNSRACLRILNSRACLRILSMAALSSPYQSSPLKGRSHSLFIW
jgi:hypothetical protein